VPGGIHQPCNKDYQNLDYGGYPCEVNKSAWAKPEEGKVLLLGMCEISNPWNECTCGFQEALALALRLGNFSLSCQESTLSQVEQNGKCKHSGTLNSEYLDDTCEKCKPPEKIICFTPDVKPRFQNLGSNQKVVVNVESLREQASENVGFSDGKLQGTRFELCEETSRWTGEVVAVLEPYSEKIGEKIEIYFLPLCQTSFQGRDQQRSGDLPGSNDAQILRNNCVIDQEPQSHDAYTVCQAHFPQSLATIREDKQIARAIDDHRKLKKAYLTTRMNIKSTSCC